MAEVTIVIKGRQYDIACDDGQEDRVLRLASYIDNKIKLISRSGSAYNESHLMVLTALVLADEFFELKDNSFATSSVSSIEGAVASETSVKEQVVDNQEDEADLKIIKNITKRIDKLTALLREAS